MHIICNIDGAIAIDGAVARPRANSTDRLHANGLRLTEGSTHDVPLDLQPAFVDFLHALAHWPVALSLVSEEPEWIIRAMLARYRLGELPVFARRRAGAALESPFARAGRPVGAGVHKCATGGLWSQPRRPMMIYIGHAGSDACVARHADLLFARGELAVLARESALPYVPYETFDDVRRGLERRIVPIARRR